MKSKLIDKCGVYKTKKNFYTQQPVEIKIITILKEKSWDPYIAVGITKENNSLYFYNVYGEVKPSDGYDGADIVEYVGPEFT